MDSLFEQLRIALHSVWRQRWMLPNSYASEAKVSIQTPSLLSDKIGVTPAERQAGVDRVRQTLTSEANLETIVRGTDLNRQVVTDRDLAAQVAGLRRNIQVTALPDNILQIKATASSPALSNVENARLATAIAQKLIDLFVNDNLAGGRGETVQAIRFFDGKIAALERQLGDAEQRRVEFESRYMGLLPGEGSIGQRMTAARTELRLGPDGSAALLAFNVPAEPARQGAAP